MASSLLSKLLGTLKSFLKSMTSPFNGYDMEDAKVNSKDGEYSVLYRFAGDTFTQDKEGNIEEVQNNLMTESGDTGLTDIKGNVIQLDVLLSTINVKQAIAPLLSGLNNLQNLDTGNSNSSSDTSDNGNSTNTQSTDTQSTNQQADNQQQAATGTTTIKNKVAITCAEDNQQALKDASDLLIVLLGKDRTEGNHVDNSLETAISKGKGLLGVNLANNNALPDDDVSYANMGWSWKTIAGSYLRYALECLVPNQDYGSIADIELSKSSDLVAEYLMRLNIIQNKDEIKIDINNFVRPILIRLQSDLQDYYQSAYEKYDILKDIPEVEEQSAPEPEPKPESEEQNDADTSTETEDIYDVDQNAEDTSMFDSKQITVKLRKIQGSTDFELLGLKSNYSPKETLDDLDDVISQDDFLLALPEETQTYSIDVDDDGYDISVCEDCEIGPCESQGEILKTAITFYRNLYILHWMAKGNDMMKLHLMTEEMYGELIQEIDTLGELMVEQCGTVISPSFGCDYLEIRSYEFQEGIHIIEDYIQGYIDIIDYAYPNQTSDVQSTLDEWLRYWNKQIKYFVIRQEV